MEPLTTLKQCGNCGMTMPAYYATQGLCDDCKWDTWVPHDYQVREAYRPDMVWGHLNATRHPRLGVEFLDQRMPWLVRPLATAAQRPRSRTRLAL